MEYAALDLETTGLDPERDRVIEVGAVAFTASGDVRGRLELLADPGRAIPETVRRLTGITPALLAGAPAAPRALAELASFIRGRQPVGHGARLDVDFLAAAGLWPQGEEILDTLDVARILLPAAGSHSLPALASELGLQQARPHRALDDADATRQLLLRLRQEAMGLDEQLQESMLSLVAPYGWAIARFFAEALTSNGRAANPGAGAGTAWGGGPRPALERAPAGSTPAAGDPDDDPSALVALLRPGGPLARALPGYEPREEQQQMLLAVAQAMQRGRTLVVEAGTGTGKSLAYLIPALARAVRRGQRAVVATHTLTLQEQLMGKDIPGLREWLPWSFEACLLKGRSNYVSLRRWRRYLAQPCDDVEELKFKLKVMVWLHGTSTGDRAELRLQGQEEALWARIASDALDCVGVRCTDQECFVHRARAEAERADLVVVNHALLLADAATGGNLLPSFDHLVVDEAHHLEDAATQSLRSELEGQEVLALLDRLAGPGGGLIQEIVREPRLGVPPDLLAAAEPAAMRARGRTATLFEWVYGWARGQLPEETARRDESLRLTDLRREREDWRPIAQLVADAVTALSDLDVRLGRAVALSREGVGGDEPDPRLRELETLRGRLGETIQLLHQAFLEPDPNRVYWLTLLAREGSLSLRSAPLEVGSLLAERVYRDRRCVVHTSASLTVGGSFDFFMARAGISAGAETLALASPFDYLEQSLVCLPTDMPEPDAEDFVVRVEEVVADVARRLRGRTLVLFTSHRQLRDVYAGLKHRSDLDEVLILGQGLDGQRRQVLEAFQESRSPLLLGTASLWEGIDVPGDHLACVVIVRLPFPVPTEPVFAARAERLRDPFAQYALPIAALRLKQGFGRLIRSRGDRGAVLVLDGRVLARDYGRTFLDVLPRASRCLAPMAEVARRVEEWLAPSTRGGGA
jgi:ATP-dependent DNA helicase DinG